MDNIEKVGKWSEKQFYDLKSLSKKFIPWSLLFLELHLKIELYGAKNRTKNAWRTYDLMLRYFWLLNVGFTSVKPSLKNSLIHQGVCK